MFFHLRNPMLFAYSIKEDITIKLAPCLVYDLKVSLILDLGSKVGHVFFTLNMNE
jgi:hypothetical protein